MGRRKRHSTRVFGDPFLREIDAAFKRRLKSLKYEGDVSLRSSNTDDEFEWLEVSVSQRGDKAVTFQALERNMGHLYVQSVRRHQRGKILVRMEHVWLINNADRIVASYQRTVDVALSPGSRGDLAPVVRDIWSGVTMESVGGHK